MTEAILVALIMAASAIIVACIGLIGEIYKHNRLHSKHRKNHRGRTSKR